MSRTLVSTILLTAQLWATGAVPLAHARERETAPAAFESHHDASCVVLHDALRCALCWYSGSLVAPPRATALAGPVPSGVHRALPSTLPVAQEFARTSSQPRAPPLLGS